MVKKGLCETCVNDKTCTFPRKFPVWQCEEFSDKEPTIKEGQKQTLKCSTKAKRH